MQTNCTLFAKVRVNKKLNTLRVAFTFDASKRDKNDKIIITVNNAAYISGDICDARYENAEIEIEKVVRKAKDMLRTNNVQFV